LRNLQGPATWQAVTESAKFGTQKSPDTEANAGANEEARGVWRRRRRAPDSARSWVSRFAECRPTPSRQRLGPFDLVMLEVGAFHPAWGDIHLGPLNALKAHALLGGGALLPVHWGTFSLAMHAWDEPANTLLAHADPAAARLLMPRLGEAVEPAQQRPVEVWWRDVDRAAAGRKRPPPEPLATQPAARRDLPWPLD
jgi:hypothetical protein